MLTSITFLAIGLLLIVFGADYFVASSSLIAKRFGIPKLIIGLTIVSLGTSAPEFGVNIVSSIHGYSGLALGNILGSNIANILFIFAGAALFTNRVVISKDSLTQVSLAVVTSLIVLIFSSFFFSPDTRIINRAEGLTLFLLGFFIGSTYIRLQGLTRSV